MASTRTVQTGPGGPVGFVDPALAGQVFGRRTNTYGYVAGMAVPPVPWSQTEKTGFPFNTSARAYGNLFAQFEQAVVGTVVLTDLAAAGDPVIAQYLHLYQTQQTLSAAELAQIRAWMNTFVTDYLDWLAL